jgi:hypothetical protein
MEVQQSKGKAGNWGVMVYSFHNVVTLTWFGHWEKDARQLPSYWVKSLSKVLLTWEAGHTKASQVDAVCNQWLVHITLYIGIASILWWNLDYIVRLPPCPDLYWPLVFLPVNFTKGLILILVSYIKIYIFMKASLLGLLDLKVLGMKPCNIWM